MDNDELREENKSEVISNEEKREKAMQAYLDDVAPISEFINKGFKAIDESKMTENGE